MKIDRIKELTSLAIKAAYFGGLEILKIYDGNFDVEEKSDGSPLTIADKNADDVINSYLAKTDIPILSEEGKSIPYSVRKDWSACWIVDPLDGTKEFIKRNGDFTVNIALIENGQPIAGVIYVPVTDQMYFGGKDLNSFRINNYSASLTLNYHELVEKADKLPSEQVELYTVVASRSHLSAETESYMEELKKTHGEVQIVSRGSSLKICMVAEGNANEYPRFAPTMEWDIAAGHAIAKGAGKEIIDYNTNQSMQYNRNELLNNWFIVQ